jgi:hypothetical protein
MDSQVLKQSRCGMAVGTHTGFRLFGADHVALIEIEVSFEVAYRMAELKQLSLQRDALLARELGIVGRPACRDRRKPVNAICEMQHRERVDIGIVVAFDDVELRSILARHAAVGAPSICR